MSYETILYEVEDHVLTITFNRPDQLNAWSDTMFNEFMDALDRADADDDVRVVVVTGAGRAFSAGADLSHGETTFDYDARDGVPEVMREAERDGGGIITLRIFNSPKPFIAAINGHAIGFGLTVTFPMDVRIAADSAKFGIVFTRRGIPIDAAAGWFLPRIVSMTWAAEWSLSGKNFGAEEALRGGLVRSVHPADDVLAVAKELAHEIADYAAPVAVALTRQMLWRFSASEHPMDAHRIDSRGIFALGRSADSAEGVTAFLEKRKPEYELRVSQDLPPFYPWWEEPEWS